MTMDAALLTAMPSARSVPADGSGSLLRNAPKTANSAQPRKVMAEDNGDVQDGQSNFKKTLQKQLDNSQTNPKKLPKLKHLQSEANDVLLSGATLVAGFQMPAESALKGLQSPLSVSRQPQMQSHPVQTKKQTVRSAAAIVEKPVTAQTKIAPSVAKAVLRMPPSEKSSKEPAVPEKTPTKPLMSEERGKPTIKAVYRPSAQAAQTAIDLPKSAVDKAAAAEQKIKEEVLAFKAPANPHESALPLKMSAKSNGLAPAPLSVAKPADSLQTDTQRRQGLKSLSSASSDKGKPAAVNTPYHAESKDAARVVEHISRAFEVAQSPLSDKANPVQNASQITSARAIAEASLLRPVDQIVQTMQLRTFGAEQELRMTLAPQELGAIRLTFCHTEGQVVGLLEVQKNETRRELEQAVGQLTAAMENAGLQVRRIEIVPWTANAQHQSSRGDLSGQGFDASGHHSMYRSAEERTPLSNMRHGGAGEISTQPLDASVSSLTGDDVQTGINLFI